MFEKLASVVAINNNNFTYTLISDQYNLLPWSLQHEGAYYIHPARRWELQS